MSQQQNNPFAQGGPKPFSFGQAGQQPASSAGGLFSSGQPNTTQQQNSNPFGSAQSTATSLFGKPATAQPLPFGSTNQPASMFGQPSAPAASNPFGQPQQASAGGLFGSSGAAGTAQPTGSLFGTGQSGFGQAQGTTGFGQRPSPFSFGQSSQTQQPGSIFGGGAQPFGAPQQQQQNVVPESSRTHVCVHKETLEKLKSVDWSKVSEKALFHELPEQIRTVCLDIARRQSAERSLEETIQRNITDLQAMHGEVRSMVNDEALEKPLADDTPTLSAAVSTTIAKMRAKADACMRDAGKLTAKAKKLQSVIQRSLHGLLDCIRTKKETRSAVRADAETASLFDVLTSDVEDRLKEMLVALPSLRIRLSALEPATVAVKARKVFQCLRDLLLSLSARQRDNQHSTAET